MSRKTVYATDQEILAAYEELQSAAKVSEHLGISQPVIYRALDRNGIEKTGRSEYLGKVTLFNEENSSEILKRYEAGALIKDLVRDFGGSYYSIKRAINRAGGKVRTEQLPRAVSRPSGISKMSEEEIEKIRYLRSIGKTQVQIAESIGRSQAGVGHILAKNYFEKPKIENELPRQIYDLYQSGLSMREIGKKLNVSANCAHRWLKKLGADIRPWQGKGKDHSQWAGGRNKGIGGYWLVKIDSDDPMSVMANGQDYVLEHRLIMARKMGRALLPNETVHHIDGDPGNNSIENLQLRHGHHGKHVVLECNVCGSNDILSKKLAEH